jgi:predicted P-loop ATPase
MNNISNDTIAALQAQLEAEKAKLEKQKEESQVVFPVMRTNARGVVQPTPCQVNTEALLAFYGITCRYNEMTKDIEVQASRQFNTDTKRNATLEYVADCARLQGYSAEVAVSNLVMIGNENSYHPARDWILSKEWDGVNRMDAVYDAIVTVDTFDNSLKEKVIRRWMIANVALLMHSTPFESDEHRERGFLGTEGVLVLQGNQGLKKTQFFQSLVPAKSGFFADGLSLNPSDKDSVALIVSHWFVELGELDAVFRKADIAALRAWLTKKEDKFRPPYAKAIDAYPRRTGICATVNDMEFLPETGENRRYWNIAVTNVKRVVGVDLQQLWAQAYAAYRAGERFWLEPDERQALYESNKRFERSTPLIEVLEQCVIDPNAPKPVSLVDDDYDIETSSLKKAKGTAMGATELIRTVFGSKKMVPTSQEAGVVGKWLLSKRFRTATNKRYYVLVTKTVSEETGRLINKSSV